MAECFTWSTRLDGIYYNLQQLFNINVMKVENTTKPRKDEKWKDLVSNSSITYRHHRNTHIWTQWCCYSPCMIDASSYSSYRTSCRRYHKHVPASRNRPCWCSSLDTCTRRCCWRQSRRSGWIYSWLYGICFQRLFVVFEGKVLEI